MELRRERVLQARHSLSAAGFCVESQTTILACSRTMLYPELPSAAEVQRYKERVKRDMARENQDIRGETRPGGRNLNRHSARCLRNYFGPARAPDVPCCAIFQLGC